MSTVAPPPVTACLLCSIELEGFAEPLCAICKQDNYALLVAGAWQVFSNEGRLHASAAGAPEDDDRIVCLARERRRAARRR